MILIIFSILILFKLYLKITCGYCQISKHLIGKVAIVTGGTFGIGYETAKDLANRGAKVYITSNDIEKGKAAAEKIINTTGNENVFFRQLDLSSLMAIRSFCNEIEKDEPELHILVNNAGTMCLGNQKTRDELDLVMQINYFGPFLLTNLLIPLLKSSVPSRIINVSSNVYLFKRSLCLENINNELETNATYSDLRTYIKSKYCIVLMTIELQDILYKSGVTANVLHPGIILNEVVHNFENPMLLFFLYIIIYLFDKSSWEGAQTTIYLCVAPELENTSGKFFCDCKETEISNHRSNKYAAQQLWEKTENLVSLKLFLKPNNSETTTEENN